MSANHDMCMCMDNMHMWIKGQGNDRHCGRQWGSCVSLIKEDMRCCEHLQSNYYGSMLLKFMLGGDSTLAEVGLAVVVVS